MYPSYPINLFLSVYFSDPARDPKKVEENFSSPTESNKVVTYNHSVVLIIVYNRTAKGQRRTADYTIKKNLHS